MTAEQVDAQFKLVEQVHNLRAEVERLRAALEEIAKDGSCACHTEIAIRALKDKP